MPERACKDCGSSTRALPNPGPRCATCWRAEKRRRGTRTHETRVSALYGLPGGAYDALYAAQGGRCAICRRATGRARRLAVDHDHESGRVRGLLCKTCNYTLLGRYDTAALVRAIEYLTNPPAYAILEPPTPRGDTGGSA